MKTKRCMLIALLVLAAGATLFTPGCSRNHSEQPAAITSTYHCPMHPTVVSDKPGDCPICGMKLVPIEGEKHQATALPGLATVSLLPDARQRMGLTLGTVEKRSMARTIRTPARIAVDETQLYRVTTKVEGWVEQLFVAVSGQTVRRGDPLLTIYSPQLVSAQQEYLSALQAAGTLSTASGEAAEGASSLMESARQRLHLWDISDEQIARLEKTRQIEKTLTLYSPANGYVTEKNVLAGQKIMTGESLMVVADLSIVWGDADIYESDLPYVKTGMPMTLTFPYWPGKTFSGTVSFISPSLNKDTRTLTIRLEIPNPESLLKLEMYATANLNYPLGEKLAAPESAIMRTGERDYAFRDTGDGKLVPVKVDVGLRSAGFYEIRSGLNEGDRVVTSANFLVDSESSMRAALEAVAGELP